MRPELDKVWSRWCARRWEHTWQDRPRQVKVWLDTGKDKHRKWVMKKAREQRSYIKKQLWDNGRQHRHLIDSDEPIPMDHPLFQEQLDLGLQDYTAACIWKATKARKGHECRFAAQRCAGHIGLFRTFKEESLHFMGLEVNAKMMEHEKKAQQEAKKHILCLADLLQEYEFEGLRDLAHSWNRGVYDLWPSSPWLAREVWRALHLPALEVAADYCNQHMESMVGGLLAIKQLEQAREKMLMGFAANPELLGVTP